MYECIGQENRGVNAMVNISIDGSIILNQKAFHLVQELN